VVDPVVPTILVALLVMILGLGAWDKWCHVAQFEGAVAGYKLLPTVLVKPFALAFAAAETLSALLLLIPGQRSTGAILAALILGLATLGILINLARGRRDVDCGCGGLGHGSGGLSGWLVLRNVVLLAAVALVWLAAQTPQDAARPMVWLDGITFLGATLSLLGLYYTANVLMDNRITKETT